MSAQTASWKLALRAICRALLFLLPFAFAGRLDWWRGWLFVGLMLLMAGVSFAVMRRRDPGLLRRRLEPQAGVMRFDRFVLVAAIVGLLSFFAVAGLDVRYGWWQLSAAWIWPGIALELLGFVPIYLAVAENPFLERQVSVFWDSVMNSRYPSHHGHTRCFMSTIAPQLRRRAQGHGAAYADFIPAFLRMVIIGHQFVNADWNRFRPTNAVNRYQ